MGLRDVNCHSVIDLVLCLVWWCRNTPPQGRRSRLEPVPCRPVERHLAVTRPHDKKLCLEGLNQCQYKHNIIFLTMGLRAGVSGYAAAGGTVIIGCFCGIAAGFRVSWYRRNDAIAIKACRRATERPAIVAQVGRTGAQASRCHQDITPTVGFAGDNSIARELVFVPPSHERRLSGESASFGHRGGHMQSKGAC